MLKDFLKREGVYEQFCTNCLAEKYNDLGFLKYVLEKSRHRAIISAFFIYDSPEGEDFWKEIQTKWHQELKRLEEVTQKENSNSNTKTQHADSVGSEKDQPSSIK